MGFAERLKLYSIIGIDTPVLIYHFENHPVYSSFTQELFSYVEGGNLTAVTSVITLMEITVRPIQLGSWEVAHKYEALLVNFPQMTIVDLNRDVARNAARLRAEYRLHPADALQAAACLLSGAQVFVTNDRRLVCLRQEMDILVLEDLR